MIKKKNASGLLYIFICFFPYIIQVLNSYAEEEEEHLSVITRVLSLEEDRNPVSKCVPFNYRFQSEKTWYKRVEKKKKRVGIGIHLVGKKTGREFRWVADTVNTD